MNLMLLPPTRREKAFDKKLGVPPPTNCRSSEITTTAIDRQGMAELREFAGYK